MVDIFSRESFRANALYITTATVLTVVIVTVYWQGTHNSDKYYQEMRKHHALAENVSRQVLKTVRENQLVIFDNQKTVKENQATILANQKALEKSKCE